MVGYKGKLGSVGITLDKLGMYGNLSEGGTVCNWRKLGREGN